MLKVLLTGATGYIGSHTWVQLLNAGYHVVGFDNFSNSKPEVLNRIEKIAGKKVVFESGDVRDVVRLQQVLMSHRIDGVIHLAGLKAVGESVAKPLDYYEHNVLGAYNLLRAMQNCNVTRLVFSSSATVYGLPVFLPYTEDHPLAPTNPYGNTKRIVEVLLRDFCHASPDCGAVVLRYFNPVGAHESGLIGEDPQGVPNNLMPYVAQVAVGRRQELSVFGGDYPTKDGTGVRDYIHVMDLADGHVRAIDYLTAHSGFRALNLGSGQGFSVLELINAFECASGKRVPYKVVARRDGDIAEYYADAGAANAVLGWRASRGIDHMCRDTWHWQSMNPNGYE
jgi:UDP-glucose 4-epimerase